LNQLAAWAPDPALRRAILVENPARATRWAYSTHFDSAIADSDQATDTGRTQGPWFRWEDGRSLRPAGESEFAGLLMRKVFNDSDVLYNIDTVKTATLELIRLIDLALSETLSASAGTARRSNSDAPW
jgi:hypothetical protein